MWAAIVNIVIGLFLMIAPGIFHFDKSVADQFYIIGPIVITFSFITLWEVNHFAHYFNIPAALWLIIASFIFHFQSSAAWIAIISGVLIILLSLVKRKMKGKYGGGWRSLWQKHPLHMQKA